MPGTLTERLARKGIPVRDRTAENPYALILADVPRPCFFCGRPTFLVDLDYQGPYCGNDDAAIRADLERYT